MKIPSTALAFLCVIIIWSTTPLAIQWSSGNAPLTSLLIRMMIGMLFCLAVMGLMATRLPFDDHSRRLYVVGGLSIYLGMSLVYWSAQLMPSGWIAVIYGLSPLITGVISYFVEPDSRLTPIRIVGILLGFFGLYLVFNAGLALNENTIFGVSLLFISVLISASSSVLIRHLGHTTELQPMQTTTGSLIVALPCFALTAWILEPAGEVHFSTQNLLGILYLGLIGTGIGFTLYYYLLKKMPANQVALIMLITPITALLLGNLLNDEPVISKVWLGAGFVCVGLLLYQYKPKLGLFRKL